LPKFQQNTFQFPSLEESTIRLESNLVIAIKDLKTIWFKSIKKPIFESPIDSRTKEIVQLETFDANNNFLNAIFCSGLVTAVNSRHASLFAENKLVQLLFAKKVGLNCPETLVSATHYPGTFSAPLCG
jgi:glutathione synthase/RimK-type ligase-like ATP-grasp enzyme